MFAFANKLNWGSSCVCVCVIVCVCICPSILWRLYWDGKRASVIVFQTLVTERLGSSRSMERWLEFHKCICNSRCRHMRMHTHTYASTRTHTHTRTHARAHSSVQAHTLLSIRPFGDFKQRRSIWSYRAFVDSVLLPLIYTWKLETRSE